MTDLVDGRGRRDASPDDPQPQIRPRPRILSDPELNAYRPTLWTRVRGVGALTFAADVAACLLGWLLSGAAPARPCSCSC